MYRVIKRLGRVLGNPVFLFAATTAMAIASYQVLSHLKETRASAEYERHLNESHRLIIALNEFTRDLNELAEIRSEYLSTVAMTGLIEDYGTIREAGQNAMAMRGLHQVEAIDTVNRKLTDLQRQIIAKNNMMSSRNRLQVILRENENVYREAPEASEIISILSDAAEANNLILIGEISRYFTRVLNESSVSNQLENRLRTLAFGSSGLFAVVEDLVIADENIARTILEISHSVQHLIGLLAEDIDSEQLSSTTPGYIVWGAILAVLLAVISVFFYHRNTMEALEKSGSDKAAERLESLERISGEVAHDISNVINVIVSGLSLIKESSQGVSKEQQKNLNRVLFAAEKSVGLIDRLLTFARRKKLMPEPVFVNELLTGLYDVICLTVGDNVDVELDLFEGDARIYIDAGQLESSIINLCINSRNAMDDAGGVIKLETRIRENKLLIAVSDTGHGIPEHVLPKVFEPFFTTDKSHNGQGLGLSTVYGFVKQSSGDVHIKSKVGKGTQVFLEFKL